MNPFDSLKKNQSSDFNQEDLLRMKLALKQAKKAQERQEVPVGAVAFSGNQFLGGAYNLKESKQDPLGHAEIRLISKVSKKLKQWRLTDVSIYVTLEPCLMCMGALIQARVSRLVFACFDPKAGACGSLYDLSKDSRLNHRIELSSGVLEQECSSLLSDFFRNIRTKRRSV